MEFGLFSGIILCRIGPLARGPTPPARAGSGPRDARPGHLDAPTSRNPTRSTRQQSVTLRRITFCAQSTSATRFRGKGTVGTGVEVPGDTDLERETDGRPGRARGRSQ